MIPLVVGGVLGHVENHCFNQFLTPLSGGRTLLVLQMLQPHIRK